MGLLSFLGYWVAASVGAFLMIVLGGLGIFLVGKLLERLD